MILLGMGIPEDIAAQLDDQMIPREMVGSPEFLPFVEMGHRSYLDVYGRAILAVHEGDDRRLAYFARVVEGFETLAFTVAAFRKELLTAAEASEQIRALEEEARLLLAERENVLRRNYS